MRNLIRSRLFWVGVGIRLICLPILGSMYLTDLFVPFLDTAVQNISTNPWSLSPAHYFPYGSVLYVILATPRYLAYLLIGDLALGIGPIGVFLIKAPLFLIDVLLLWILLLSNPRQEQRIILYYWCNPVLIYITFVHGQLDIVAMAFCITSLWLLCSERNVMSALCMAAATLCKFHVMACVPLVLAYLWRRDFLHAARKKISRWALAFGSVTSVGFLPVILADRILYVTTDSPQAARVFGMQISFGDERVLYIGFAALILLIGRLCVSSRITERGLFYGAGMIFGALLLITDAMPGWYFWVLPFLALFYSEYRLGHVSLFYLFVIAYIVLYGLVPYYAPDLNMTWRFITFSATQTLLLGLLIELWVFAVRTELPLHGSSKPIIIGISGDSGTGKDHTAGVLVDLFSRQRSSVLLGDDYHRWERGHEKWEFYSHLNPWANHLLSLANDTLELQRGRGIYLRHYDHEAGEFRNAREINPNRTVIVQGLHTLYLRGMRKQLDVKIFLAPNKDLQLAWKVRRDVHERKHPVDKVLQTISQRESDVDKHIEPQRSIADWIIELYPVQEMSPTEMLEREGFEIAARHILWNDIPLRELSSRLSELEFCDTRLSTVEGDMDRLSLEVRGQPKSENIAQVAEGLFSDLRYITRGRKPPCWRAGLDGVTQLICAQLVRVHLNVT